MTTAAGQRFVAWTPAATEGGAETASSIVGSGTVSDLTAIAGKTLRPLDGYCIANKAASVKFLDAEREIKAPDFTITTGTGDAAVTTPYYIYKKGDYVKVKTGEFLQEGVEIITDDASIDAYWNGIFAMPDHDITLTGMRYFLNNVEYMDWDSTTKKLVKKNTSNLSPKPRVYILTGDAGGTEDVSNMSGWYAATRLVSYASGLNLKGDTHLILADKAELMVGNSPQTIGSDTYNIGIYAHDYFTIYGQEKGSGILDVNKDDNDHAIFSYQKNITFNSGIVFAKSEKYDCITSDNAEITINGGEVTGNSMFSNCINASYVTINGGTVKAEGYSSSIHSGFPLNITGGTVEAKGFYHGIVAEQDINITGGQVKATYNTVSGAAGIFSSAGNISLGWTNADDFIKATSYGVGSGKSVKTVAGQRFVAYNAASEDDISANCVIGCATCATATTIDSSISLTNATAASTIAGKTLKPLDGYFVSTADNNISLMNGTTAKTADFTISNTPYYIYKASTDVTMRYDAAFAELTGYTVSPVEGEPMQRTFTMPADDVTLATTAVTGLAVSGTYTYDGRVQTPAIKKGDAAFAATNNYTMAFKQNSVDVSEAKNAGTYDVTLTGLVQYIGTATLTGAFTIGQKEVTISGITANSKTYDGTTSATISAANASVVGKVDGDNIGVDFTVATAVFADANAGENKPVTITGVTLVGSDANNYTLSEQPTGVKGTITRKTLTITADSDTKEFDGTALKKNSYTYTELAKDDAIESVTISGSQTEVGSSNNVPSAAVIKNIAGNAVTNNYAITYANGTLEVIPAKITLFAENTTNLWATFCDENARTLPEGCTAYTISSVSGTTVNLSAALTTIPAYTPVLIKREANATLPILTTYQAKGTAPATGYDAQTGIVTFAATGATVYGNAGKTAVTDSEANHFISDQTYVLFNGKFVKVGTNSGLAAHRLWLNVSSAAARELIIGDDATGIASMDDAGSQNADGWYGLDGRKLDKAPKKKGVYVNSGRKVVIK